jgi:tRNA threonylcarbamoyladenosine biosynthesis protein TsaE
MRLGKILEVGDVISLNGDLGSGKTTFVKGIVRVKCPGCVARSPSFIIVNEYVSSQSFKIYHVDFYRVKDTALDDIGFYEFKEDGIVLIEWGELVENFLPPGTLVVKFEVLEEAENGRKLSFYGDENWRRRLKEAGLI